MTGLSRRNFDWERGVFVVSIDTELAWGAAHRRDDPRARRNYSAERPVIAEILRIFERHGIPGTWAIVGHLFLDSCKRGTAGRPHPGHPRPEYDWLADDWFDIDPCSDVYDAPDYYAPDVVDHIAACPTPQEIASHGFSHMIADDPGAGPEVLAGELAASRRAAVSKGHELRAFVYPRNAIAHVDQLHEAGFTSYRGRRPSSPSDEQSVLRRRMMQGVDRLRPLVDSAVWPAREASGIWNIPQTYYFAPATSRRHAPVSVWVRSPIVRLQQAIRERSLFHLWFHPADVTADPRRGLACLDRICAAASRARYKGRLDTLTMSQLVERLDEATLTEPADVASA